MREEQGMNKEGTRQERWRNKGGTREERARNEGGMQARGRNKGEGGTR
jgi:hypothetical protein